MREPGRGRIAEGVREELSAAIRDLRLVPGALVSESELSMQLGVSRTPLREAISRLVEDGLLTVVPQVGTRVALIDLAAVERACFIRTALERSAFTLASGRPHRDVGRLREILTDQETALRGEDGEAFFRTDEALHEEIFALAGFPGAWQVVRRAKVQLDRLRRLTLPEVISSRSIKEEHERLVDLLEAGDASAGSALVEAHAHHVIERAPELRALHPAFFT